MKKIKMAAVAALAALGAIATAGCQPQTIIGPNGAPLIVAVSTTSTTDLLTDYRRSITVVSSTPADVLDTVQQASAPSFADEVVIVPIHGNLESYHIIDVAEELAENPRLCNVITVNTAVYPVEFRNSIRPTIEGLGVQLRLHTADPGNEILAIADECMSEGV